MKTKWEKRIVLMAVLLIACIFPANALAKNAAAPAKTTLKKVSVSEPDQVTLKWKKSSGATSYTIYYRKAGAKSWKTIASVSGKTKYTHVSSKKYPLKPSQKYTYRVRPYNKKTKKYGPYSNTKTVQMPKAAPEKVKLRNVSVLSSDKVKISWKKASNVSSYQICYRKAGAKSWKTIATVSGNKTSYTHKASKKYPLKKGTRYTYAVRAYRKDTKKYGPYSDGKTVRIPKKASESEKEGKAQYTYEIKLMNPYPEVYNVSSAAPILYIKTENPDYRSILVESDPDINEIICLSGDYFDDVQGVQAGNWLKVEGGYLCQFRPEEAGTYHFRIYEVKEAYRNNSFVDASPTYCYQTGVSLQVQVEDYQKAGTEWIQSLIGQYTTPGMTPKEKFEAIIEGEFNAYGDSGSSKYRYHTVKGNEHQGYSYITLLMDQGTIWQNHRLDSFTSPRLLCDIGNLVGYDVKMITGDISDPYHAYVTGPEGELYMICPMQETGLVGDIQFVDFSNF